MQGAWQTLSDQALSLLATSLPRARVLVWSAIVEANHGLLPGLFLAVRSHFEMTALLAEFRLYLAGNAHPKETFERIFWANRSWTKSMTEAMASMAMNVDETKAEVDPRSVMALHRRGRLGWYLGSGSVRSEQPTMSYLTTAILTLALDWPFRLSPRRPFPPTISRLQSRGWA